MNTRALPERYESERCGFSICDGGPNCQKDRRTYNLQLSEAKWSLHLPEWTGH